MFTQPKALVAVPLIALFIQFPCTSLDAAPVVVRGEVGQRAVPVKAFDAEVHSALLAAKPGPGVAGAALDVTVKGHAVALPATAPGELFFITPAGTDLADAMKGIVEQLQLRHRGWFAGKRIELSVAEAAAPADLASASLATALAIDAMIVGWNVDPAFSALGKLMPDGQINPVPQPIPRVLAAFRGGSQRIAVPDKMWAQVSDLLVAEGIASFSKAQMFTVGGLDDVVPVASNPPSAEIERAVNRFGDVQRALQAPGVDVDAELVRPAIKDALREVLMIAPNHLSARLLLGRTTGQYKTLSVPGSLAAIDAIAATLMKTVRSSDPTDIRQIPEATLKAEIARLQSAKSRFDSRSHTVLQAVFVYADVVKAWYERPPENAANRAERNRVLYATAKQVRDEIVRLTPPAS